MTALARLQAEFRAWMQQTPVTPHGLRTHDNAPDAVAAPDAIRARVSDTRKTTRDVLLDVYRDAYALRLIEALQTDYPGLHAMAGTADFDAMARAYIKANPSQHPSVRWFGRSLADFLGATPPFNATPAAAEMARFEWLLGEAFDAADAVPATFDDMVALPADAWNSLRFTFVPSLRCVTLRYQVPQAWLRRDAAAAGALEVPPAVSPESTVDWPGVDWLIWRTAPDAETQFRSMDPDEAWMLDQAREGVIFPDLCDGLVAFAPAADGVAAAEDNAAQWAAQRAAGLLRAWIDTGCVTEAAVA